MLDFLELEETVGRAWHRLAGDTSSFPRHPEAAVELAGVRPMLGPFFRALGGERAVQIAPSRARSSSHRLRLRQYIGLGEERIEEIARDHQSLLLPARIDFFADRDLNRDLYLWLAAFMALMPRTVEVAGIDPLQADLAHIARSTATADHVLKLYPGFRPLYRRLAEAVAVSRHSGSLPRAEQAVEHRIQQALAFAAGHAEDRDLSGCPTQAPRGYLPALPVPLWPRFSARAETAPRLAEDMPVAGAGTGEDGGRKVAVREDPERGRSDRSPFVLNRFEKILSLSEMLSVDRPADDSDDDNARTADDLEDMTLGERRGKPASRFRFALDLPPEALSGGMLATEIRYPEWDYRRQTYLEGQVAVVTGSRPLEADAVPAGPDTEALIRRVRRQFETLRPRNQLMRAQLDGAELDIDQVVRRSADLLAGSEGTDRIHMHSRPREHDLAVTLLTDVSLSTDAWIDNRRIIDVEKEALLVLAHGLSACGDRYSIQSFTSRRRDWVRVETLKGFDDRLDERVEARIAGLKPGYYTRIGAAVRHAAEGLKAQPNSRKLLLVLTDGKPNDLDYYEGRYALEDTRKAVAEARREGIAVFAVTVDRNAEGYLPSLFGRHGFAMVASLARLPKALPAIYRSITG